jgi:ABC-type transporter Mla subunit MlaD
MVDVSQLTAISTEQTADRLDQLLLVLESIDQRLADKNVQIERLIEASVNTQASIDQQTGQVGELLHDTISSRVDALSRRVLANDTFKKELEKLKEDILRDVKKSYSVR